jgi:hypothetical protein
MPDCALLVRRGVYFNLDAIEKGLTPTGVARLRRAYFVGAVDRATSTVSPNEGEMRRAAARAHLDYSELSSAGVTTAFFDARADEAGIAWR